MAKAVAKKAATAVAVAKGSFNAEQYAGRGMEGADKDSFAIPFLATLQKGSPQVDEASGVAIEGAKAGMLFNTVSKQMYDGKKGVLIIPCAFKRVFLRWGARGSDTGGFKGEYKPEVVQQLRDEDKIKDIDGTLYFPLDDGTFNPKKSDRLADTRNHYILMLDEKTGATTQALQSLTSTQIKKSKNMMSALASIKREGANGLYTPPTFATILRCTTVPESNDKGSWYGVLYDLEGEVKSEAVFNAALEYNAAIARGLVRADYDSNDHGEGDAGHSAKRGF